ncbi:NAD+ synthase [Ferrimicrobium acidiphilum]|uniref:NAD+ synthase n=1 Tax=Ferrimicrobium acidiphilum TaxID=121039 RepID=UPI0023F1466F|nr:NAD+ synthase [Ferrimicrobium acidiphilum]
MSPLKLACAQVNVSVGAIEQNADRCYSVIEEARQLGVDILLFPELALTGYPPEDLLLQPQFIEDNLVALRKIATMVADDIVVVVGFVRRGDDLHNSIAVLFDHQVQMIYDKQILPNYTVFDECRYFRPGSAQPHLLEVNGVAVGLAICEDAWSPQGAISQAAAMGAEVVLVANASPYEMGRQAAREQLMEVRASDESVAILYCNLVGGQDELVFDGGSFFVGASGNVQSRAKRFVEDLLVVDFMGEEARYRKRLLDPRGELRVAIGPWERTVLNLQRPGGVNPVRESSCAPIDPPVRGFDPDEVIAAIVLGTRDYVRKNRAPGVLVAVSGGIDSALVAALAVEALGPSAVDLVALPSRYSSSGSLTDATDLAHNLGARLVTLPIEAAHSALTEILAEEIAVEGVVDENLQSRIRGILMMALSNSTGRLVLTTGNKSELAVGYSTLYGDTAGGFAVIKDLYKTQVYAVAKHLNQNRTVIPPAILSKPPSAELRPDQLDTDSLPDYPVLDAILTSLIDRDQSVAQLVARGIDAGIATRIENLIRVSEYKRRQSPLGVRLSSKAFGKDRRMPISMGSQ